MIHVDSMAERMKERAGESYRPSNGTEGEIFMSAFCSKCKHDNLDPKTYSGGCEIIGLTMAFDTNDAEYPREWIIDSDGQPTCTAFELEKADA